MKLSKIVNVQPILPKIDTHNAWTYPMECAKNWTDPNNVTYVSMATKIPIIKHREFLHISMCYISVIYEHIASKFTPVMQLCCLKETIALYVIIVTFELAKTFEKYALASSAFSLYCWHSPDVTFSSCSFAQQVSPGEKTTIMVFQTLVDRETNGNYGVLGNFCAH